MSTELSGSEPGQLQHEDREVSVRLLHVRKQLGLSQKVFSDDMGISLRAYQTYERGQRAISSALVRAAYQVFRINPVWLLVGKGELGAFIPPDKDQHFSDQLLDIVLSDMGDEEAEERRSKRVLNLSERVDIAGKQGRKDAFPVPVYVFGETPNVYSYAPVDPREAESFRCIAFSLVALLNMGLHKTTLSYLVVRDGSMEPTISVDDLLLVDQSSITTYTNGIYTLEVENDVIVRRLQMKTDGSLVIKSDNPDYDPESIPKDKVGGLNITGRVVWYGRRV